MDTVSVANNRIFFMSIPIVIIQTTQWGRDQCYKYLPQQGLEEDKHYLLFGDSLGVLDHFVAGTPQLLVAGTFNGHLNDARLFVQLAKGRNPSLKIGFVSGGKDLLPEADFALKRNLMSQDDPECYGELARILKRFLEKENIG